MKFRFEYIVLSNLGDPLKKGVIIVRNQSTKIKSRAALENYFKRHFIDFGRLKIISCEEQIDPKKEKHIDPIVGDFFNIFGFKK